MSNFNPDDFEKVLDFIRSKINGIVECRDIRSIESNFNTKGMTLKDRENYPKEGTIIIEEDEGAIVIDISVADNSIRSFILKDKYDIRGKENIVKWFKQKYSLEKSK